MERELKRKQKVEELNRKKELRAAKQKDREALQQAKQREKEAKQREKEAKQREKEAKQHEKEAKQRERAAKQKDKQIVATGSKQKRDDSSTSRSKRDKATENVSDEIDDNRCCICFGTYSDDAGTSREWLMCNCNRWVHEDCIDLDDIDDSGRVCPLC